MTFACRRTLIESPREIQLILEDDAYREILQKDVLAGDVVLYCDENGDANHSGIVVWYEHLKDIAPIICSKWGKFGEYIHGLYDVPNVYGPQYRYFRCEP